MRGRSQDHVPPGCPGRADWKSPKEAPTVSSDLFRLGFRFLLHSFGAASSRVYTCRGRTYPVEEKLKTAFGKAFRRDKLKRQFLLSWQVTEKMIQEDWPFAFLGIVAQVMITRHHG